MTPVSTSVAAFPPYYDSLIGKLTVKGTSRRAAIERLKGALDALDVGPIATTVPLYRALARNADVIAGDVSTQWLERWLSENEL